MCIITVFSISMLCYVVSDLDSPFSGFFRVDLSVLSFVLQKLESMYLESLMEEVESTLSGGIVKVTEIPSEKPGIKKMNDMKRKVWYKEQSFVWLLHLSSTLYNMILFLWYTFIEYASTSSFGQEKRNIMSNMISKFSLLYQQKIGLKVPSRFSKIWTYCMDGCINIHN